MVVYTGNTAFTRLKQKDQGQLGYKTGTTSRERREEEGELWEGEGKNRGRKGRGEKGKKRRKGRDRRRKGKAEEGRQDEITVINFQTETCSHNCYLEELNSKV